MIKCKCPESLCKGIKANKIDTHYGNYFCAAKKILKIGMAYSQMQPISKEVQCEQTSSSYL